MPKPRTWLPGEPCPNCNGPMPLIPLPSKDQLRIASDPTNGVPLPQTVDTAPAHVIEEEGRLYRCDKCDSKVRTTSPPALDPVEEAHGKIASLSSRVASLQASHDALTVSHGTLAERVKSLEQPPPPPAAPVPGNTTGE